MSQRKCGDFQCKYCKAWNPITIQDLSLDDFESLYAYARVYYFCTNCSRQNAVIVMVDNSTQAEGNGG